MLNDSSLVIFVIGAALLLAMPGPTNALLATSGAARGLGNGSGNALALVAAELAGYALALAMLLSLDELAGSFRHEIGVSLRIVATVLLLATAWRMWRSAGMAGADGSELRTPGAGNVFLLTLFNPKALILGFALFPPVIAQQGLLMPALLFAVIVIVTGFGWILAGAAMRTLPGRPGLAVARLSSLVIGGFACYFAVTVALELMSSAAA